MFYQLPKTRITKTNKKKKKSKRTFLTMLFYNFSVIFDVVYNNAPKK